MGNGNQIPRKTVGHLKNNGGHRMAAIANTAVSFGSFHLLLELDRDLFGN